MTRFVYENQEQNAGHIINGSHYFRVRDVDPRWADFLAGNPEPYHEPTPEEIAAAARAGMSITFAQLLIGLVAEGWITEPEGEAWLGGTLPAPVLGLIATLPARHRFPAKARAIRPSIVMRADTLVNALAAAQGKTAEQLDAFFATYGAI